MVHQCFYIIDHFDSKAKVEEYISSKAGKEMKWSSVRMPAYFNNILTNLKPMKLPDGSFIVATPMEGKPMHGFDVDDLGGCVASGSNILLYNHFL